MATDVDQQELAQQLLAGGRDGAPDGNDGPGRIRWPLRLVDLPARRLASMATATSRPGIW